MFTDHIFSVVSFCWWIYHKQILMESHNHSCAEVKPWGTISWNCHTAAALGYRHTKLKQLSSYISMMWSIIFLVWEANVWNAAQNNYWKKRKVIYLSYIYSFYYSSNQVTSYFWHHYTPKLLLGSTVCITDSRRCREIKLFTWGYTNRLWQSRETSILRLAHELWKHIFGIQLKSKLLWLSAWVKS